MADKKNFLDKPRSFITDDRDAVKGTPHSIRDLGKAIKQGAEEIYNGPDSDSRARDMYSEQEKNLIERAGAPTDPKNYGR